MNKIIDLTHAESHTRHYGFEGVYKISATVKEKYLLVNFDIEINGGGRLKQDPNIVIEHIKSEGYGNKTADFYSIVSHEESMFEETPFATKRIQFQLVQRLARRYKDGVSCHTIHFGGPLVYDTFYFEMLDEGARRSPVLYLGQFGTAINIFKTESGKFTNLVKGNDEEVEGIEIPKKKFFRLSQTQR